MLPPGYRPFLLLLPSPSPSPSPFATSIHFAHGGRGLAERPPLASSARRFTPSNCPLRLSPVQSLPSDWPSYPGHLLISVARSGTLWRSATTTVRDLSVQGAPLGARNTYSSSVGDERNEVWEESQRIHPARGALLESAHSFLEDFISHTGCAPTAVAADQLRSYVPATATVRTAGRDHTHRRLRSHVPLAAAARAICCIRRAVASTAESVEQLRPRLGPHRQGRTHRRVRLVAVLPLGREAFRSIRVFDLAHGFRPRGVFVP
jgi:hypothetical protein